MDNEKQKSISEQKKTYQTKKNSKKGQTIPKNTPWGKIKIERNSDPIL